MVSYELAKELRDAEWPQGGNSGWIGPPDKIVLRSGDRVYAPTLAELIEACGTRFEKLERLSDGWRAVGYSQKRFERPDEAVARLWLALHGNGGAPA